MKSPNSFSSTPSSSRSSVGDEHERCSVFVGHVPLEMNEFRLGTIFSRSIGHVRKVTILRDFHTGRSRECAFIRFDSEDFAKKAMKIRYVYVTFYDPITDHQLIVNSYDAKLAKRKAEEQNLKKGAAKRANDVWQSPPNFVQVDDISSTVEMSGNEDKVPEKPLRRNSLDDEAKEMAMREHLEEIESRTSADNRSIFVGRFMQDLTEWHIDKYFSTYGTITSVRTYATAFRVDFAHKRMAAVAIRSMNGREYGETGKMFICDWWSWTVEERRKATNVGWATEWKRRPSKKRKSLSKSPLRQKGARKSAEREGKRSKPSEGEAIFLPMTKKHLPPAPFEYLSTSESENEMENCGQTEASKLAQKFSSRKDLSPSERMAAILKLISSKSDEKE
ncbi:hypothetical protein niasHT_029997 [Heterodera trifolii]|uniref:RRM domain-containing protein n=1 Tax=Heterodera trifolii TaxID=157864 RepID=A0ABD2JJL5_9BILA